MIDDVDATIATKRKLPPNAKLLSLALVVFLYATGHDTHRTEITEGEGRKIKKNDTHRHGFAGVHKTCFAFCHRSGGMLFPEGIIFWRTINQNDTGKEDGTWLRVLQLLVFFFEAIKMCNLIVLRLVWKSYLQTTNP